jgi:hypothetical protein
LLARLDPILSQLDEDRAALRQSRKKGLRFLLGGAVVLAAAIMVLVIPEEDKFKPWAIGGIVASVIYLFAVLAYFTSKWKDVKRKIKQDVISEVVQGIDASMRFNASGYISYDDFCATRLFRQPDRYNGEDLITGIHGKTQFRLSELHAEERRTTRDSNGNTRTSYYTIFKGFMLIADFNKHFHGHTFVLPDNIEKFGFSWLTKGLQKWSGRGQLVYMENVEFEKEFVVYATDQVEARYILTPTLMESILQLKRDFNAPIHISFVDSHVCLAVQWSRDFLEPDVYDNKPLRQSEWLANLVDEIYIGLDIIEQLDLNTRIWTKD